MKSEAPMWREILNWGAVIYFLGLPALAVFLGFTHLPFAEGTEVAKFLGNFHLSVSALVAAMAGLNSFDRYKSNGTKSEEHAKK
jgi:hypothetical protein